jgi:hypothetical protein
MCAFTFSYEYDFICHCTNKVSEALRELKHNTEIVDNTKWLQVSNSDKKLIVAYLTMKQDKYFTIMPSDFNLNLNRIENVIGILDLSKISRIFSPTELGVVKNNQLGVLSKLLHDTIFNYYWSNYQKEMAVLKNGDPAFVRDCTMAFNNQICFLRNFFLHYNYFC